ncbi:NAD(P)H-dependent glycerol-3-phosphate dehydrogenase [Allocoprobacillus halotolerans]|uniref:Glycerol-3-phosphate dehydrogenase [NAD(P)+] n=1 Tax=Allocoprobacillus halotolerans TaxID=2944914 RepID=A0ABY5I0W1_9FIRM|nr:NAD(P)H-dependent glycerol-3-phosphate dehydrogenase [Allocoprobacillus halotolerans]UTY38996.1 NAD(P)H-dependent glycerol-3-phosphate dehydrogenase [Allocoprobacillus halotolerans]
MKIAILGTGSWATALARVLNDNGHRTMMYGIDQNEIDDINIRHCNYKYFKDVRLENQIVASSSLKEVVKDAQYLLITIPTQYVRHVLEEVKPLLTQKVTVINAAKGFDMNTNMRMSDTIRSVLDKTEIHPVVSLIGPSHAEEVVERMLTVVCAVSLDEDCAKDVQKLFSNHYFRVYTSTDEVGAEYGAAYKNVIAVASGIIAGLGYGDNTRAALITRGLYEMSLYGTVKGANRETFFGLTGIGDLVVTCSSIHSRNFQAGLEIGQSNRALDFMTHNTKTCEGIRTCKVIHDDVATHDYGIEVPIVDAVYRVLYENALPQETIDSLMLRDLKAEQ